MSPAELTRRRLRSLGITAPLGGPRAVVERLGAMQAQDAPGTRWAVALRCGAGGGEVDAALADGALVRTWPMRGTLHLVPAAELRWMLDLLAPAVIRTSERRRQQLELDAATLDRARDAAVSLLGEVGRAERDVLLDHWRARGISTDAGRGYHLLFWLGLTGVLVQLGADGFALAEAVLPPAGAPLPRDEALARLGRAYVLGHGPVTAEDLAWWAGIGVRDARAALEGSGGLEVRVGKAAWWFVDGSEPPEAGVHLLPGFDELLLGYKDRSSVLDPAHAERVCPGANGVFRPTVVVDGRMIGTWQATARKREVRLTFAPFEAETPLDPEVASALAARYGAFVGLDVRWV